MLVFYAIAVTAIAIWVVVLALWLIDAVRGGPESIMVAIADALRPRSLASVAAPFSQQGLPLTLRTSSRCPTDAAPAENPRMLLTTSPPGSAEQHLNVPLPAPHFLLTSDSERA